MHKHECEEMEALLRYSEIRVEITKEEGRWRLSAYDFTTSDPGSLVEFQIINCPFCGEKLGGVGVRMTYGELVTGDEFIVQDRRHINIDPHRKFTRLPESLSVDEYGKKHVFYDKTSVIKDS